MKRTSKMCSSKVGMLAVILVSVFSVFQSCKKDEDSPVYPPSLEKSEVVSATEIKFTFSKPMDKATGEMTSTYQFEPSVEISKAVVDGKEITLTLAKPLNGGQYKVTFDNLKSSDGGVYPNGQMATLDYTSVWKKQTELHVPFANGGDPNTWTFFSLKNNQIVNFSSPNDAIASTNWDIAFALDGTYMLIYSNSKCSKNPPLVGDGAIGIEEKTIDEITKVGDLTFQATCANISAEVRFNPNEGYRNGAPWCEKDADDPFDYDVKNNPLIPFRIIKKNSIVFKTAEGKYGKLEMQSIYKGTPPNPLPADYDQYYLTFRYVIQENGKNELDIPIDVE